MNEYLKRYIELKKSSLLQPITVQTASVLFMLLRKNWNIWRGSRQRKYWWMYMTYWTLRRMPTTCSVKSEIAPIKKHSSGWVR